MKYNEPEPLLYWMHHRDETVETNCTPSPQHVRIQQEPVEEPSQLPKEPPKYDYDKLIAESTGLYGMWWILWKRIHPEWALYPERPKEPELKVPSKPKPAFNPLSCKRCYSTWRPRSKDPPVQCPRCHSPYWDREKMKK